MLLANKEDVKAVIFSSTGKLSSDKIFGFTA